MRPAPAAVLLAIALAPAGCGPSPTNDEEYGRRQIAEVPAETRDAWEEELARLSGVKRLWAHTRPDGPFEPAGRYLFGKFHYALELYRRGDEIALVSWGIDASSAREGGPWIAIGSGHRSGNEAKVAWSCVNPLGSTSQGGGARIEFHEDDRLLYVEYYHDTQPQHLQWGTAVRLEASERRALDVDLVANEDHVDAHRTRRDRIRVRGLVASRGRPLPGATIHLRGSSRIRALTDAGGVFEFEIDQPREVVLLACAAPGHRIAATWIRPDAPIARFELEPLPSRDHPGYRFVSPWPDANDLFRCGNCHDVHFDQWRDSAHATSGTSPLYRAAIEAADAADCRPCHEPALHLEGSDPERRTQGIGCDPCHKIADVDPDLPVERRNRWLRPDPADPAIPGPIGLVFGPLPDVAYHYMGASHSILYERSRYCAGCHELANEHGVPVDTTWSDWLEYARRVGRPSSCQACHMPPVAGPGQIARYQLPRDPSQFHDHSFPLSPDGPDADALPVELALRLEGDRLQVDVRLENTGGHAAPAGKAGRTLHLVVAAEGPGGDLLPLVEGATLGPEAGLPAAPDLDPLDRLDAGTLAGLPGLAFRRRLGPDGAPFQAATSILEDTRLAAGAVTRYEASFDAAGEGPYRLTAWLLARPVPWDEWNRMPERMDTPLDRILVEKTLTIERNPR